MRRALCGFAIVSAVLMTLVAVATHAHQGHLDAYDWLVWFCPPACYLVLAVGSGLAGDTSQRLRPWWLGLLFVVSLSPAGLLALWGNDLFHNRFLPVVVILYLVMTAFFLRRLRTGGMVFPAGASRILLPLLFCVGAGLVVSSLFLAITSHESGPTGGWSVLLRRARWITDYASVGQSAFLGPTIPWLQPIFAPVGYAFYLLGVAGSVALLGIMVKSKFSLEHMHSQPLFARLAALIMLTSLWLYDDIFWGWRFDLSAVTWGAAAGALCWLVTLLFGAVFVWHIVHGKNDPWLLGALLILQLPLVTFNLTMVTVYFTADSVAPFPGLGLLMVGLQIETWAAVGVLARAS
jgi:hypothetical protein